MIIFGFWVVNNLSIEPGGKFVVGVVVVVGAFVVVVGRVVVANTIGNLVPLLEILVCGVNP